MAERPDETAPGGQLGPDTQHHSAPGGQSAADTQRPVAPGGQPSNDTQSPTAPGGQDASDTQATTAPGGQPDRDTHKTAAPGGHEPGDTHRPVAPGGQPDSDTQQRRAPGGYDVLQVLANQLEDLEDARKAADNRLRSLTHAEVAGERGGWFGKSLPGDHPVVEATANVAAGLARLERDATRALERQMAALPLGPWVEANKGAGLKTVGRLLGLIGDPAWHPGTRMDDGTWRRPPGRRTLGELFSFCGVAGPGMKRRRGVKLSYDPRIKPKLDVIVEGMVKAGVRVRHVDGCARKACDCPREGVSRWGRLYLDAKAAAAGKVHSHECRNSNGPYARKNGCGTSVDPGAGAIGAPWQPGHVDRHARRLVMREVLRELWGAAGGGVAALPEPAPGGQPRLDTQLDVAPGGHIISDTQPLVAPGGQRRRDTHVTVAPGGHRRPDTQLGDAPGGHATSDTHQRVAPGGQSRCDTQTDDAPGGQQRGDTQTSTAPGGHGEHDTHAAVAPGGFPQQKAS